MISAKKSGISVSANRNLTWVLSLFWMTKISVSTPIAQAR